MLQSEAELAIQRVNAHLVTTALLTQAGIGSLLDKDAARNFKDAVKGLSDG